MFFVISDGTQPQFCGGGSPNCEPEARKKLAGGEGSAATENHRTAAHHARLRTFAPRQGREKRANTLGKCSYLTPRSLLAPFLGAADGIVLIRWFSLAEPRFTTG